MSPTAEAIVLDPEAKRALSLSARLELAKRFAAENDVLSWGKILFPHKFYLPYCMKLHQYLVDIKDEPFTSTEAPRGFSKTTIQCFLISIFNALVHPNKYNHYLNVQSTATKAISENIAVKHELESNQLLIALYGSQISEEKWTEKQFELRSGPIFTGVGAGESIRGINYKSKRPDYVMADDLYDDDDIYSPDAVAKKSQWFWGTLYPALDETKKNCIHLQGTAISKADLLASIRSDKYIIDPLGKKVFVKSKTFKAIEDTAKQVVLWPEYMSHEKLMAKKELMGSIIFNRELQNERRSDETSIIKEHWLKFHSQIPADAKVVAKILGVDPSIGEKEGNDFTGGAVIYATEIPNVRAFNYWIEEMVNEHLSLNQRVNKFDNMNERHNFTQVPVEGIAGFRDFVAELKRRTSLPVKTIDSVKNKIANLERESSKFEAGRVSINKNIPPKLKNELIEQLLNNYPDHDDMRDAVLLALNSTIIRRVTMEML